MTFLGKEMEHVKTVMLRKIDQSDEDEYYMLSTGKKVLRVKVTVLWIWKNEKRGRIRKGGTGHQCAYEHEMP